MANSAKKEAILKSAERLFYEQGFHAVGMQQILKKSGVATMTLYRHFASKEHLIEEVLRWREGRYWSFLERAVRENARDPLNAMVKAHCEWLEQEGKNGCLFLRALEEFSGKSDRIEQIARHHKRKLQAFVEQQIRESGPAGAMSSADSAESAKPENLAFQLTLLLEGATSMAEITSADIVRKQALSMLQTLLNQNASSSGGGHENRI